MHRLQILEKKEVVENLFWKDFYFGDKVLQLRFSVALCYGIDEKSCRSMVPAMSIYNEDLVVSLH